MYEWFFSFYIVYILPRNTNGKYMRNVRQRPPLVCDSLVRNTLNHNHRHRLMYCCIVGRAYLECPDVDFWYRNRAMVPSRPNLWHLAACDRDCMASIGIGIWRWNEKQTKQVMSIFRSFSIAVDLACSNFAQHSAKINTRISTRIKAIR